MRILLVHNYYQDPGGEDSVFHQEAEALRKKHTVELLTFRNRKGLAGLIQYLLYPYNIGAAFRLRNKIRDFAPDLIHVHNIHYASGPILFRTARRRKIPVVFTLHNYRMVCPSALLFYKGKRYMGSVGKAFPWEAVRKGVLEGSVPKTFLTALTYRLHAWLGTWKNVDAFLPLTTFGKSLLLQGRLGIPEERIHVKPNFIEPLLPENAAPSGEEPYFLYVGRLSEEKGVRQLLHAFNRADAPPLHIVGDGPLRYLLSDLVNPRIRLLGYISREKLGQHIAGSRGVVIPSICLEGFPLAMLEGFSLKTPVILSREVAAGEIIDDGKNGFMIDPRDFHKKIAELYRNPDLKQAGEEGFKTYEALFTKEKVMNLLEDIYRKVLI
ncbi:MAG: glycosyltransferase family 4 protein [Leadbetterella sp.]|nr:glycosyltransferase family 4 protein [Leadbetterella sp.]